MRRREFITVVGGAAVSWSLAARAQQATAYGASAYCRAYAEDPENKARGAAFEQALQQLGWAQGRNVRIDYRFAEGNAATSRKQAEELVALAPDVIVHWQFFDRSATSDDPYRAGRVRDCPRSSRLRLRR
jgi:putative tryptophan/tyrosine transport system substrate-binding protein